jgi:hypothetical protein
LAAALDTAIGGAWQLPVADHTATETSDALEAAALTHVA